MSLREDLLAVAKDVNTEKVQKYGHELYNKCIKYVREQAECGRFVINLDRVIDEYLTCCTEFCGSEVVYELKKLLLTDDLLLESEGSKGAYRIDLRKGVKDE